MGNRQVNELLVIGVFAGDGCFGRYGFEVNQRIELRQHACGSVLVVCQPFDNFGIVQHPLQLVAHGWGGNPGQPAGLQAIAQRLGSGVVEYKRVQNDVGVEDDSAATCDRLRQNAD